MSRLIVVIEEIVSDIRRDDSDVESSLNGYGERGTVEISMISGNFWRRVSCATMRRIAKAGCGCTNICELCDYLIPIIDSSTCSYLDRLIDAKGDRSKS